MSDCGGSNNAIGNENPIIDVSSMLGSTVEVPVTFTVWEPVALAGMAIRKNTSTDAPGSRSPVSGKPSPSESPRGVASSDAYQSPDQPGDAENARSIVSLAVPAFVTIKGVLCVVPGTALDPWAHGAIRTPAEPGGGVGGVNRIARLSVGGVG